MKIIISKLSYSFGFNIVNALFPLLTLPIVFRALDQGVFGEYVLVNVIYQLTISLFSLVLIQYFIREYTNYQSSDNEDKINILGEFFIIQVVAMLISLFSFVFLCFIFNYISGVNLNIAVFFILPLLTVSINFEWYFYATQKYKILFYRNIFIKCVLLILVFLFINENNVLPTEEPQG